MDVSRAVRRNPYAARIAREGVTVSLIRSGRGRPKKGTETGPTVTKTIRLTPAMWKQLEKLARAEGVSLHALVRHVLLSWLEHAA